MVNSMQLSQIAGPLGAQLLDGDAVFESVSIDSRTIQPGQLYVAIKGKQFDGHEFVEQACKAGATALMVSGNVSAELPQIKVDDTRVALGQLARLNREACNAKLVSVTGSSGKTTVKEMLASILSELGNTLATSGNFNNEIGVPLTLLRLEQSHEYGVIELGASAAGEIGYLVSLVEPEVAIITNVARAHLSGFGRLSDVASAKSEILTGIRPGGFAILNADDEFYMKWRLMALAGGSSVLAFSINPSKLNNPVDFYCADLEAQDPSVSNFVLVTPEREIGIRLPLPGQHNLANALAAAAASMAMGATIEQVKTGLEKVKPASGRMISYQGLKGCCLIDDSYNANTGSVKAAIETLASYPGKRILVLGDMGELGGQSQALHREMGRIVAQNNIDAFFTLGEKSADAYAEYKSGGRGIGGAFNNRDELVAAIRSQLNKKSVILVKGSRSAHMENVVEALKVTTKESIKPGLEVS